MIHHLRRESRSKFTLCGHRNVPSASAGLQISAVDRHPAQDVDGTPCPDCCPACALVASGTPKKLVRRAVAHDAQDEILRAEVRQLGKKYREYLRANPEARWTLEASTLGRSIERVCAAVGVEEPTKGAKQ